MFYNFQEVIFNRYCFILLQPKQKISVKHCVTAGNLIHVESKSSKALLGKINFRSAKGKTSKMYFRLEMEVKKKQ